MHVGLYTLFFRPGQIGGIETYLRSLIRALGEVDQKNQYTLFVSEQNRAVFADLAYPNVGQVTVSLIPPRQPFLTRVLRKLQIMPAYITQQLSGHSVDLIHYPGTTIDQTDIKIPCILTMHDIQQEYFPDFFSAETLAWRRATYRLSAQKARHIIADAEYTRQTIIDKYGISASKITAIPLGIDDRYFEAIDQVSLGHIRQKYNLPETFLFFPANPWPHKNHSRLFAALRLLKKKYQTTCPLVLTGAFGAERDRLQTMINEAGVAEDVHTLGYIPYEDLPSLYAAATALVFPSLFEGFGIPVLEAMACGCPVICSNTTSLPEVAGDAALLIDPLDVAQMAEAIYNVWYSKSLRHSLRDKGMGRARRFNWYNTARRTIQIYQSLI